ncbi:nSTAND1 domain-containing NTPase [Candidatus Venteria ishoeyi]|uniref:Translocation protein TolB n=1 Tax=Candidatus Venteria ishoeyi TaxID=1899563 RepID=A0A1H6FB38_9GAMM|nr:hypothetical protein [Candidatus Venteria ishoeyi]SEH07320.1 translocation protein TolB [Candidatus Venteria ishoeyi]
MKTIRIFVSSPGDVIEERQLTQQILQRLQKKLAGRLELQGFFWEDEPVLATETFQTQFPRAADSDLFICLLWSRIGTPLPKGSVFEDGTPILRDDGSEYESGTVAEFEDALDAYEAKGSPAILMYFKRNKLVLNPEDKQFAEKTRQMEGVHGFYRKWFQDEEGRYPRGHSEFRSLTEFEEKLETHLCKLLVEKFLPADSHSRRLCQIQWSGSPFRGLEVFDETHAPVFFGRNQSIDEVYNALREQAENSCAFVLILGLSGSGKSSLMRAGILPLLRKLALPCVLFRPSDAGDDLLTSLQSVVEAFTGQIDVSKPTLTHNHTGHTATLPVAVLLLDQFEEFFTLERVTEAVRQQCFDLISAWARSGKIWVMGTMRSEFLAQASEYSVLAALLEGKGRYLLMPPSPSEIHQIITRPAQAAGLSFEHLPQQAPLNERIFDEIADQATSLALLEFTLQALYQRRHDNTLTNAAYQEIGGVTGALAQHADHIYQQLNDTERKALQKLMRALVTVSDNETMPFTARRAPLETLSQQAEQQALVEKLIDARLLISDKNDQGQAVVRIVHEALFQHWPVLENWLSEDREWLRIRAFLADNALRWQQEQQLSDLLLPDGKPLMEASYLLEHWREILAPHELAYIEASQQRAQRRRDAKMLLAQRKLRNTRRWVSGFAILNIIMLGLGVYAWQKADEAEHQADVAQQAQDNTRKQVIRTQKTQSLFLAHLATRQNERQQFTNAALLALEALPDAAHPERPEISQATEQLYQAVVNLRERKILQGHRSEISQIRFSPDGKQLLTASSDKSIRLWSLGSLAENAAEPVIFASHAAPVTALAFSPDGAHIASAASDGIVRIWNVQGEMLAELSGHQTPINSLVFSPDSLWLLSAAGALDSSPDNSMRLWEVSTGKLRFTLQGHQASVTQAHFSPDAQQILSASQDGSARLWSVATGQELQRLEGHQGAVLQARLSLDGRYIITASEDKTAKIWDQNGQMLFTLAGHEGPVLDAQFSPDQQSIALVATISLDGSARLWELDKGTQQSLLQYSGFSGELYALAFSPDGQMLATAGNDGLAWLWDSATGKHLVTLAGHEDRIQHLQFSPDGRQIATAGGRMWDSKDNTARLWQVYDSHLNMRFSRHQDSVNSIAFSPDGHFIASASGDPWNPKETSLRLWQRDNGQQLFADETLSSPIIDLHFRADGKQLLSRDHAGQVQLWQWQAAQQQLSLQYTLNPTSESGFSKVLQAAYTADGQWLITARADGTAQLWDSHKAQVLAEVESFTGAIEQAVISPDKHFLLTRSAEGSGAILWAIENQEGALEINEITTLGEELKGAQQLLFSPDSQYALTLHAEHKIRLWSTAKASLSVTLSGHEDKINALAFSPDGKRLFSISGNDGLFAESLDNSVRIWQLPENAASQAEVLPALPALTADNALLKLALSPDGQHLLILAANRQISLYDSTTMQLINAFKPHSEEVTEVMFSPDGKQILSSSADHSAQLWPVFDNTAEVITYAKNTLARKLSPTQRKQFFLEE